jgi:peptidoglycan/xylan/chitin deacetylase (PgdA/CDA1 family)
MSAVRRALQIRQASTIWLFHDVMDAEWFEQCVDEISSARTVLPLGDLASNPGRANACAITFDDGLKSVRDIAHPVLMTRQLPYTVFVCTDVLTGGLVPWFFRVSHLARQVGLDALKGRWVVDDSRAQTIEEFIIALKQVPLDAILEGLEELEAQHGISPPDPQSLFLSADDVKMLAATGATIGSHTHRHPILSCLTIAEQALEVEQSVKIIESLTGSPPAEFAYPNGTYLDFDASTIELLRASGFRAAVTTASRHLKPTNDAMALPRVGLSDGDSTVRRLVKTLAPSLTMIHVRERTLRSPSSRAKPRRPQV